MMSAVQISSKNANIPPAHYWDNSTPSIVQSPIPTNPYIELVFICLMFYSGRAPSVFLGFQYRA